MTHKHLNTAKTNKADEFYTQMSDIVEEMRNYRKFFHNKVIYCNCDDPYESYFFKYFALSFNKLKLKKLIATSYIDSPIASKQLTLFDFEPDNDKTTKNPHKIVISELIDENEDGGVKYAEVEHLLRNKKNVLTRLKGNGDFRSQECIDLLKESDIVITNPPFSLFREYVAQLIDFDKKFIIIGNTNALTYKEIFKLIKENKIRTGYTNFNVGMFFYVPDSYEKYHKIENGQKLVRVAPTCWFTNFEVSRHYENLSLYKKYNPDEFPHYDNYDAIEVSKVTDIPYDWEGVMGVPLSFLDKYNPKQFEIIGLSASAGYNPDIVGIEKKQGFKDARPNIDGKVTYARVFIKKIGEL